MDISAIFEIIKTNPACYFVAGIVLGYFLRGFVLHGFVSESRSKRPSRYQTKKADPATKRSSVVAEFNEPSFDLSDVTLKAFTSQRITNIALDQNRNEFQ